MDDIYLVPHRMTEADLQRIREAEGIDSGDYGQGDQDQDDDGAVSMLGRLLIFAALAGAALGAAFWPY